ncbi:8-amino-7-oxononanoate synthase [Aliikangiella maris]|uniref:8-amino-7-oxononanoate synthase n=2 Tax=Aliikangiella maris TaxID=3162458 RepID=A0ABV2BZD8_9GAMM
MKFLNLSQSLAERDSLGETRQREVLQSAQGRKISLGGQTYVNFASNDYLGLAALESTQSSVLELLPSTGVGSGASHMICGHHQLHELFEHQLAGFLQRQAALTFTCGYMANLAVLQALARKGDLLISDKLNHASLIDGAQLSQADSKRYPHCDLTALENRLKRSSQNTFVVTDSVFSMDGDIAPLTEIAELCDKYNALLIVDDAHGFGVLGTNGQGCCEHFQLNQQQVPVLMSTFGKALGGFGAAVSGEKILIDYLIQFARSYIYTTALPPMIAAVNLHHLQVLMNGPERVNKLRQNIAYFQQLCLQQKIPLLASSTAIQPVVVGDNQTVLRLGERLRAYGVLVGTIRPPTVPPNSARIRITLTSEHLKSDIEQLVNALDKCLQQNDQN